MLFFNRNSQYGGLYGYNSYNTRVLIPWILIVRRNKDGKTKLIVKWRNLILLLFSTLTLGWIALFSTAFFHLKYQRGYTEVSYFKTLALPFIWDEFNRERGQFYLEKAFESLEEGDFQKALNLFRNGLIRKPDNLKARLALAEIYEYLFERPLLAVNLLEDGIEYTNIASAEDRADYIQKIVFCASRNKMDAKVIEIIENYESLYGLDLNKAWDLRLAYFLAISYRNKGELDHAKELIEEYQLNRTSSGMVLSAQIMWDEGNEQQAIQLIADAIPHYEEKEIMFEKIIQLCEAKGLLDQMRLYCNLYRTTLPDNYLATVAYLTYYYKHEPEQTDLINQRVREYADQFSENVAALRHLAIVSAKFGNTDNVRLLFEKHQTGGYPLDELLVEFTIIESKLRAGLYEEAINDLALVEQWRGGNFNLDQQSIIYSIKTAAYYGMDNQTYMRMNLDLLLESPRFKLQRYFAISKFFLEVGAPELSLEVMERCMETRASDPAVTQSFVEIHLKTKDADELTEKAKLAMDDRRLPNHLLREAYLSLASDKNLFVSDRGEVLERIEAQFKGDYLFRRSENL